MGTVASHTASGTTRSTPKPKKRVSSRSRTAERGRRLKKKCAGLLGEPVKTIEYPGGRSRRSVRLVLEQGPPVIASIRPKLFRARVERKVLRALSDKNVPIPRLLASDGGNLLIQEEIVGERLAIAMHRRDPHEVETALDGALTSLARIHHAGSDAGLDERLATLGTDFEWIVGFLDRPAVVGNILEVPALAPKLKELESLLEVRQPRFIKWDARPGNAIVRDDDEVYWFDWEHCGARNRLDDMAWLLADEYVPELPEVEERLIDKHIAHFADGLSLDDAKLYLSAYGVFHLSVRLGLICKYKLRGEWWNQDYCINGDKIGVTWECMRRVCRRGERWAQRNPYTGALSGWFRAVLERFDREMTEVSVHSR